jgi:hypothetical protein
MSKNHDDAITSLMEQMREQQGYEASSNSPKQEATPTPEKRPRLLLPELKEYPDNARRVGSHSIWNAYVQPSDDNIPFSSTTCTLPTNPQVEVIRRRAFEKFKQDCQEVLTRIQQQLGIKLPIISMLEKWHMDAKLTERQQLQQQESKSSIKESYPLIASTVDIHHLTLQQQSTNIYDPILLPKQGSSSLFLPILASEVQKGWRKSTKNTQSHEWPPKFGKKSQHAQKALHRCICVCLETFQQQLHQAKNQVVSQQSTAYRKVPKITTEGSQMQVAYAGISLRVHAAYYEKLQRLFDRKANNSSDVSFEEALFCLLCRYDMLQGAGLQAALPGSIMDVLLERFGCHMECFASPLNCRYQRFASAFDIDRCFGSVGSFFDLDFGTVASDGGCYQANPPFCEGLIAEMTKSIMKALQQTNSTPTIVPLMFVVFVPAWNDSKAYQGLLSQTSDGFLTRHLLLEQGKHWYAEGTQHRRKDSFRVASFDTSIFFFQNEAAKQKWKIDDEVIQEMEDAFCQDPGTLEKESSGPAPSRQRPKSQSLSSPMPSKSATGKKALPPPAKKASRKKKQADKGDKKKRKWSNQEEENTAQLDLLLSLGLSPNSTSEPNISAT